MISLLESKVIRVIADNLSLAVVPRMATMEERGVVISTGGNKLVARFGTVVFAATFTVRGWKPLPAMTALAGKKLYSDEEATAAIQALFKAAADAKASEQGGE